MLKTDIHAKALAITQLEKRLLKGEIGYNNFKETIQNSYQDIPIKVSRKIQRKNLESNGIIDPDKNIRHIWKNNDPENGLSIILDDNNTDLCQFSIGINAENDSIIVNIIDAAKFLYDNTEYKDLSIISVNNGLSYSFGNELFSMLPADICSDVLSMDSNKWTDDDGGDVIQVQFHIDSRGETSHQKVRLARIKSPIVVLYEEADELLVGGKTMNYDSTCENNCEECNQCIYHTLSKIKEKLTRFRNGRNANDLEKRIDNLNNIELEFTEKSTKGHTVNFDIGVVGFKFSNAKIIETEAIVASNVAVAFFSRYNNLGVIYKKTLDNGSIVPFEEMQPNSELGVPGYCQITSPGTNATDLLNCILLKVGLRKIKNAKHAFFNDLKEINRTFGTTSILEVFKSLIQCESSFKIIKSEWIEPFLMISNMQYHSTNSNTRYKVRVAINQISCVELAQNEYFAAVYVEPFKRYFYNGRVLLEDGVSIDSVIEYHDLLSAKVLSSSIAQSANIDLSLSHIQLPEENQKFTPELIMKRRGRSSKCNE